MKLQATQTNINNKKNDEKKEICAKNVCQRKKDRTAASNINMKWETRKIERQKIKHDDKLMNDLCENLFPSSSYSSIESVLKWNKKTTFI